MLLLVSVEFDANGKPDLQLPAAVTVDEQPWGAFVYWHDNVLLLDHLGLVDGSRYFLCVGGRDVAQKLTHLGAAVRRMRGVWPTLNASQKQALRQRVPRLLKINGVEHNLIPRVTICGKNPIAVALDGYELEDSDVLSVESV